MGCTGTCLHVAEKCDFEIFEEMSKRVRGVFFFVAGVFRGDNILGDGECGGEFVSMN